MYLRGLAFEYRATWESTLLDARPRRRPPRRGAGPRGGAARTGRPRRRPRCAPPAAARQRSGSTSTPRRPCSSSDCHAWSSPPWKTCASTAEPPVSAVDLEAGYFRRIFAPWSGAGTRLEVLPYSYHPAAGERESLKRLLHEAFGARSHVEIHRPLDYGASAGAALREAGPPSGPGSETWLVALFSLAQTPGERRARRVPARVDGAGRRAGGAAAGAGRRRPVTAAASRARSAGASGSRPGGRPPPPWGFGWSRRTSAHPTAP